jgi:RNA polymerase-interacting CarD/CdnL/TRCF family regulator
MRLAVGNKVIYPSHGPCLISSIVNKVVNEQAMTFYQLLVLNDGRGTLLVPVDKILAIGIRPLMNQIEISKLLDQLKKPSTASTDRRQRVRDNLVLLKSGSAFDLAFNEKHILAITQAICDYRAAHGTTGPLFQLPGDKKE